MATDRPVPAPLAEAARAALAAAAAPDFAAIDADDSWRRYQVDWPQAERGGFAIEHYTIPAISDDRLARWWKEGPARDTGTGLMRRLVEIGSDGERRIWMSDTRAEIREHYPLFDRIARLQGKRTVRLLVNGLGLGVAVAGALTFPAVAHIDVVELNPEVAELVGQFLPAGKVSIHVADAHKITWPAGVRWDLAWHDIWPTISDENLPAMRQLHHRYRRHVRWQGSWQRAGCEAMARTMRRARAGHIHGDEAAALLAGNWRELT